MFSAFNVTESGQAAPKVLIDLSHEFTFAFDAWLPHGYLRPLGYQDSRSLATFTPDILNGVDVLVVEQATTAVPFTSEEIQAIRQFVTDGGGLLIVGKRWIWQPSPFFPEVADYPINQLAAAFGFGFVDGYGTVPLHPQPHEITLGVSQVDNRGCVPGLLAVDGQSAVILTDDEDRPVMAVKEYGAGRVAVSAEDCLISNPFTGEPLINTLFIKHLFNWLSHGRTSRYPDVTLPYRYLPENRLVQGSVTLYYADALGSRAIFLLDNYPTVYDHLVSMMGVTPVFEFTIIALATGGGGYSGGSEVGIGVLTGDSYVIRVLAHELTHSFVLPGALPGSGLNEGWASLAAIRVARAIGYVEDADAERRWYDEQFRNADPDGNRLDLNTDVRTGEIVAYMGKAMWVIETLEERYGADFMRRLMPLHREWVESGRASDPVTMDDFVQMTSVVAGENQVLFFREIGTHWVGMWKVYLPLTVQESGLGGSQASFEVGATISEIPRRRVR